MLNQISLEQKTIILLRFTKEILQSTKPAEKLIYQPRKPVQGQVPRSFQRQVLMNLQKPAPRSLQGQVPRSFQRQIPISPLRKLRKKPLPILTIPEPRLPPELSYFKPTPIKDFKIELGKLDPLIKDYAVKIIECHGQNKKIIVRGTMGTKPTNITLTKEEIDSVIEKFSDAAKIPVYEGVFRVAIGNLILSAIPSKIVDSKFIIKKMAYSSSGHQTREY